MATAAQVSIFFECLFVTLPMPMFTAIAYQHDCAKMVTVISDFFQSMC
ncbi:hypothetical protein SELR_pSRC102210 (plasmid) [Selenomonas ruminantium subsp. lactilytica TAM6421]|uniref:Uncharacterized protein n=1 Tax=Selenomonas ruminantium subsp. lactilytica (strain NBRC 103574 / TAM6421) TaxID=927704 RepID=I0GW91_SELRL|nr:hypothetical protein SELR_pSRC102210 [Selenomonas ruminantium subsp. lactilytica TAM6421]